MKRFVVLILSIVMLMAAGCNRLVGIYGDDARLSQEGDTFGYAERLGGPNGDAWKLDYSGFNGVETLWILDSPSGGKVRLDHDSDVAKGDFKAVSVLPDGRVTVLFEGDSRDGTDLAVPAGGMRLKIVGQNASGTLTMALTDKDGVTVRVIPSR